MYKIWSLRFLVYKIVFEICLGIIYLNQPVVFNITTEVTESTQDLYVLIFKLLSILFFILGIVFIVISIIKKEERDWKFYVSLIVHILFVLAPIIGFAIS